MTAPSATRVLGEEYLKLEQHKRRQVLDYDHMRGCLKSVMFQTKEAKVIVFKRVMSEPEASTVEHVPDPEEEVVEDPEEYFEEEISETSEKEKLAVENCHLSSAKIGGIDSKGLVNELNEDPEAARGNKVVQGSGSETILKSVTPTGLCHTTPHEDQKQYLEEPVVNPSSISNASKAGYQLENDCEFGSPPSKTCDSHKVLGEEYLKLDDNFASAASRWDHNQGVETQIDGNGKRRKTRWDDNDFQHGLIHPSGIRSTLELAMDPKIINKKVKLLEINKKLQSPEIYDERPEGERSPSPEPVYNNLGMRINTRDVRVRKKLMNERSCILSKLAKTNLTFKSPAKPKTTKFVKKLFVPEKEYPKYNFIGLILGPKGNYPKENGKENWCKDPLKRGTYKDNNICNFCKEQGHRKYACPLQDSTFEAVWCDACGTAEGAVFALWENNKNNSSQGSNDWFEQRLWFVKFENPLDAAAAMAYMNGYKMDGKMLAVRVAGQKPVPGPLHPGNAPTHSSHTNVPCNALCQKSSIYGPPTSILTEAPFSTA
ncbi:UNVERIFIED_CONTAM: Splicing factor-like protein 1 [Sesamum radiatum]|uniref:Branchpoint-bridging protein n=1 Tax=Sesamum radiatum TaxID=300843 RepID=A0AAW2JYK5_SESRA